MMSNMPDWITAGTAVTAVVGGLFGVYTTTQSRMDVADERWANTIEIIERMSNIEEKLDTKVVVLGERLVKSEVSAQYLKEGQERLGVSLNILAGEVKQLTSTVVLSRMEEK